MDQRRKIIVIIISNYTVLSHQNQLVFDTFLLGYIMPQGGTTGSFLVNTVDIGQVRCQFFHAKSMCHALWGHSGGNILPDLIQCKHGITPAF